MTRSNPLLLALLVSAATLPVPAAAQTIVAQDVATLPDPDDGAVVMRGEIAALRHQLADAAARAEALEQRVRELEQRLGPPTADPLLAAIRGRAMPELRGERLSDTVIPQRSYDLALPRPAAWSPGAQSAAALVQTAEPDRKSAAPTTAVEDVARKEQGYFGNRLTFEPGISYTHFDNARINLNGFLALDAIFLGRISLDDVSADIATFDLTTRYSFSPRFQVDVNVPYLARRSAFASGGAGGNSEGISEAVRSNRGLGDISLGASYRLLQETTRRPDLVLSGRVKAPTGFHPFGVELVEIPGSEGNLLVPERLSTGSGVWGGSLSLSALKTIDPMVVYGSVSYFHNLIRRFDDIDEAEGDQPGRAQLGRALQFGAGVAFALNDRSSLNLGYTQRLVRKTRVERDGDIWRDVAGSQANVALMNFGATFSIDERTTLITNIGVGLTDDAPNMVVGVRLPIRFR